MSALKPNPPGVTGHIEPTGGDALDVRIQSSRIDLGIVQGFTNQVTNVTGTLQADVRVTGSGEDPHLQGYVDVQNGGFAVAHLRLDLKPEHFQHWLGLWKFNNARQLPPRFGLCHLVRGKAAHRSEDEFNFTGNDCEWRVEFD